MAKERLYSYKGRRFVVLCGCNSSWTDDRIRFGVQGHDKCTPQMEVDHIKIPRCEVCLLHPWIILPEGERYEAPKE